MCVCVCVCVWRGVGLVSSGPCGRVIGQGSGHLIGDSQIAVLVSLFS